MKNNGKPQTLVYNGHKRASEIENHGPKVSTDISILSNSYGKRRTADTMFVQDHLKPWNRYKDYKPVLQETQAPVKNRAGEGNSSYFMKLASQKADAPVTSFENKYQSKKSTSRWQPSTQSSSLLINHSHGHTQSYNTLNSSFMRATRSSKNKFTIR